MTTSRYSEHGGESLRDASEAGQRQLSRQNHRKKRMKGKFREPLKILSALLEEKSALSLIWLQVELKSGNPHIRALTQGCFRRHVTAPAPPAHLKTAFRRDGLWQQHTHTYHRLGSLSSTARRPAKTRHPLPKHGSAPGGFPARFSCGGSCWWTQRPGGVIPTSSPSVRSMLTLQ